MPPCIGFLETHACGGPGLCGTFTNGAARLCRPAMQDAIHVTRPQLYPLDESTHRTGLRTDPCKTHATAQTTVAAGLSACFLACMRASTRSLDAYLDRIGYRGQRTPTLETLAAVHEHHAQAIPFENIDVLLGRPIDLRLEALVAKLVDTRRGGYCFEQNALLAAMLRALGFSVTPLLARVRWMVPPEVTTPLTHMALRVDLNGRRWLADAGFGGSGLVTPLALDVSGEQATRYEPRRLVTHGRNLLQQVRIGSAWTDVYVLHLDEAYPIDFEVANWFTSTHPASRFRQNLLVARADGERRLSLLNREFTLRGIDGSAVKRTICTPDELQAVLESEFHLSLPPGLQLECPGLIWT